VISYYSQRLTFCSKLHCWCQLCKKKVRLFIYKTDISLVYNLANDSLSLEISFKPDIFCSLKIINVYRNISQLRLWRYFVFNTVHFVGVINLAHRSKEMKGMDNYKIINARNVYVVMSASTILLRSAAYPRCDALVYTINSSLSILTDHIWAAALSRQNGEAPIFNQQSATSIFKH